METNPWWVVDLGVPLTVREVFVTNRLHPDVGKYVQLSQKKADFDAISGYGHDMLSVVCLSVR